MKESDKTLFLLSHTIRYMDDGAELFFERDNIPSYYINESMKCSELLSGLKNNTEYMWFAEKFGGYPSIECDSYKEALEFCIKDWINHRE